MAEVHESKAAGSDPSYDIIACPWDHIPLQFVADANADAEAHAEHGGHDGVLICPRYPDCVQAYLVVDGIVVALPDDLMSEDDRSLLARRLAQLHPGHAA